jgi:hypothetical protein
MAKLNTTNLQVATLHKPELRTPHCPISVHDYDGNRREGPDRSLVEWHDPASEAGDEVGEANFPNEPDSMQLSLESVKSRQIPGTGHSSVGRLP